MQNQPADSYPGHPVINPKVQEIPIISNQGVLNNIFPNDLSTGEVYQNQTHFDKGSKKALKAKEHEAKQDHYREKIRIDSDIARCSKASLYERSKATKNIVVDATKEIAEAGLKKLDETIARRHFDRIQNSPVQTKIKDQDKL